MPGITAGLSTDKNSLYVFSPSQGYSLGYLYTLVIDAGLRADNGGLLTNRIVCHFTITNTKANAVTSSLVKSSNIPYTFKPNISFK